MRHEWGDEDDLRLEFELPRGAYATLVVKAATG
jgi:tRNA(Glu) U13 pseudouridine synthase TruD